MDGQALSFEALRLRVCRKRAARRRIGWFDYCTDSYDVETTTCRAWRIWQRLRGVREPLRDPLHGKPLPWNTYHR